MGPKTFDLLLVFVQHSGQVFDKDALLSLAWPDVHVEENNLTVQIAALRRVLGETATEQRYILTIPGQGYRFAAEVSEVPEEDSEVVIETYSRAHLVIEEEIEEQKGQVPQRRGVAEPTVPLSTVPSSPESLTHTSQATSISAVDAQAFPLSAPAPLRRYLRVAVEVAAATLFLLGLGWYLGYRAGYGHPPTAEPKLRQLTTNSDEATVTAAAISPDGKYLAYAEEGGICLQLDRDRRGPPDCSS